MPLYAFGSNSCGQLSLAHKEDVSIPTKCTFETPPPSPDDEIVRIVAGGNHTLLLMASGCVYAAGCNTDGRCGPRIEKIVNGTVSGGSTQLRRPAAAAEEKDTKDGKERDNDDDEILRFRRVILTDTLAGSIVDRFKLVSATWEGSILVASVAKPPPSAGKAEARYEEKVFVLGSSPKGELGIGDDASSPVTPGASIPSFPPPNTEITSLASGMSHSVAVLSTGEVYGWGGARKGQLGDSLKATGEKIVWRPAKIEGLPFFARGAVCGREFTVVFGDKERGELVVLGDEGNRWGVTDVPEVLLGREGRVFGDVGASWHGVYVHVPAIAAARSDGEGDSSGSGPGTGPGPGSVIAWGRNDRGQLPPPDLPPVSQLAVGSEHVLALLEDGSVAAFGWGEHGNCGPVTDSRGNVSGSYALVKVPEAVSAGGGRVVGVGAGSAASWLIVK